MFRFVKKKEKEKKRKKRKVNEIHGNRRNQVYLPIREQ